jgi:hypothetical protein
LGGKFHGQGIYTWADGTRCITSFGSLHFFYILISRFLLDTSGPTSMMKCMVMACWRGPMAKSKPLYPCFEPSHLMHFLLVWILLDSWVLFCMTRDTARVPIRGPTATRISLSLNASTLS